MDLSERACKRHTVLHVMRVVLLLATPLALERQHGQICPVALVPASHLLAQHLRLLVEVRVVAWHILHRVHVLVDCCPCRAQLCFELEAALLVVRTTALYLSPKLGLVQRRPWRASARARARIGRLRWHRAHAPGLHRATCLESARCGWDPPTSRSVLAHVCSLLLPCLAYAFSVASRLFPAWCFVLVFSWTWTRVFAYVLLVYTCCCHALLSTKSL